MTAGTVRYAGTVPAKKVAEGGAILDDIWTNFGTKVGVGADEEIL